MTIMTMAAIGSQMHDVRVQFSSLVQSFIALHCDEEVICEEATLLTTSVYRTLNMKYSVQNS